MSADPRYTPKLPKLANELAEHGPSALPGAVNVKRKTPLLTDQQMLFLGAEALLLLGVVGLFLATKPNYVSLWNQPLGIKLLVSSALTLAINFGGFLGVFMLMNRWAPADDEDRRAVRAAGQWIVGGILTVLFYIPVFFVLSVGPAVLEIQQNLAGP